MIMTLEGDLGCGKTLTMTALAFRQHIEEERTVYANYHLKFPHKFIKNVEEFAQKLETEDFNDCVFCIDESNIYMDSRTSARKVNQLYAGFAAQTRKRGVDLILATHHIDQLDKRIRRFVSIRCKPRFNLRTQQVLVRVFDKRSGQHSSFMIDGPQFYHLFDTGEVVPLPRRLMKPHD